MGLFGFGELFGAVKQLAATVKAPAVASDPTDAEALRHAKWHRRLVLVSCSCAAVGLAAGLLVASFIISHAPQVTLIPAIELFVLLPGLLGVGSFAYGTALVCLLAPGAFLTGPLGPRWMRLIGTKSVRLARIICCLVGLSIPLLVALTALLALSALGPWRWGL
jgi:hypothetical protein